MRFLASLICLSALVAIPALGGTDQCIGPNTCPTNTCAGQPKLDGTAFFLSFRAFESGFTDDFTMTGTLCGPELAGGPDSVVCFTPENACFPKFSLLNLGQRGRVSM